MDRSSRLFFFPENEPDKRNAHDGRKAIESDELALIKISLTQKFPLHILTLQKKEVLIKK